MKKIYTALCGTLLIVMLFVGLFSLFDVDATFSETENRALKSLPKFSFSALLDGSYTSAFSDYYADTFPGREGLMQTNTTLNGFYNFSALSGENSTQLVVGFEGNIADHGEALQADSTIPSSGENEEETKPKVTEPDTTEPTEPAAAAQQLGSIILVGNRAMDVPNGNFDIIPRYAQAVTSLATAFGDDVRVFSMPVPNSAEFYSHKEYHTGKHSQKDMINLLEENLGDNVYYVDSYSILSNHADEYIYFRTDHHWTALGSYYAYTAFCREAGFEPAAMTDFTEGQADGFVGSMYTYISSYPQAAVLKEQPDTVYYYEPPVKTTMLCYEDATLTEPVQFPIITYKGQDIGNKYLVFCAGDHPITIITTDVQDGPVCLLVKESYGNAFAPWLTTHYSKIIMVDPREFNRDGGRPKLDLVSFAREQGVDDLIVLNYPMAYNSIDFSIYIERLVGGYEGTP